MPITYFAALAFRRDEGGALAPADALQAPTAGAAVRAAQRLARANAGAVAFSRTGDTATGEYDPAVVIQSFGEFLEIDEMMVGA